jgi:alkyl sulfatase BDS1-like metallo-beta-lactamase superfamily hydrolase
MLDALSIRLNATRAVNKAFTINWILSDSGEQSHSQLCNCVLNHRDGSAIEADATVTLTRGVIGQMSLEPLTIDQLLDLIESVAGDVQVVTELLGLLDHFPHWFPVATHDYKFEEKQGSESE